MSQLPAMPMWWGDLFNKTDHLSNEEQWAYVKLMAKTWLRNCEPLPDRDSDLARLLNLGVKRWRRIRPRIEPFFDLSASTWRQPHLENVFRKATERKEKIVSAARLGGIAKSSNINGVALPTALPSAMPRQCQPKPLKKEEEESPPAPFGGLPPPLGGTTDAADKANGHDHRAKRGTRLATDWQPSSEDLQFAAICGLDGQQVAAAYRDFWISKPGAGGRKLNWSAVFRNWCRKERDSRSVRGGRSGANGSRPGGIAAALRDVLGSQAAD